MGPEVNTLVDHNVTKKFTLVLSRVAFERVGGSKVVNSTAQVDLFTIFLMNHHAGLVTRRSQYRRGRIKRGEYAPPF